MATIVKTKTIEILDDIEGKGDGVFFFILRENKEK